MEGIFWTDVVFGVAVGLLASGSFYVLATRADVFGCILATAALYAFEVIVCQYEFVSIVSFGIAVTPGVICAFCNENLANSLDQIFVAVRIIGKRIRLIFYKFFGKKVKEVNNG